MSEPVIVDRGGFRLAARVCGASEGAPWIVLSNSLGASTLMWEPQMEWLGRRYRILAYDTRGHGASEAPPGPYSFADLTGDVLALMDHFRIDRAALMGLSLGGMTALGLAIHHPRRFERVVCCDARADGPEPFVRSWDERLAAIAAGGLDAIVDGTLERWFVARYHKANPEQIARFRAMFLATSPVGFAGCAEALKRLDYLKDLPRIRIPVLYVVGEKDQGAPPEAMRAMAAATPGAHLVQIPDAAHLPNVDNSFAFHAAVAPFLGLS
ncbi:3-oxoadipate enol-lactonase [Chelatococcus sp. GCM10030263]|uniref:3-oxoadipate enol-lactonase n=1 Tax=Chelatococcus sp. GCM10030263 TaxID=3273387 RepID=UPI0036112675